MSKTCGNCGASNMDSWPTCIGCGGCAVSWTLRQPRTRMIRQGHKQTHEAALRASRYTRRHAWQFHGAGVEAAARELTTLSGINTVPGPLVLSYDDYPESARCVCTHPYSSHTVHGLCIALSGVLGCGCLGWSEVRT